MLGFLFPPKKIEKFQVQCFALFTTVLKNGSKKDPKFKNAKQ